MKYHVLSVMKIGPAVHYPGDIVFLSPGEAVRYGSLLVADSDKPEEENVTPLPPGHRLGGDRRSPGRRSPRTPWEND